jgi:hypothetical protein
VCLHFPEDKVQGLGGDAPGMEAALKLKMGQIEGNQESVIVEHLFKVGHHPGPVHGVAVEAAPHLVVNTPRAIFSRVKASFSNTWASPEKR